MNSAQEIFKSELEQLMADAPPISTEGDSKAPLLLDEWITMYQYLRERYDQNSGVADKALLTFNSLLNEVLGADEIHNKKLNEYLEVREIAFRRLAIRLALAKLIDSPPKNVQFRTISEIDKPEVLAELITNFLQGDLLIMESLSEHFSGSKKY